MKRGGRHADASAQGRRLLGGRCGACLHEDSKEIAEAIEGGSEDADIQDVWLRGVVIGADSPDE